MGSYVWIAYTGRPPYLPVAVADTSRELAALMGVSRATIAGCWLRYRRGLCRRTRYHKVALPPEGAGPE